MKKLYVICIFLMLVITTISLIPSSIAQQEPNQENPLNTNINENVVNIATGIDGKGISGKKVTIDESIKETLAAQIMEFKTWIEQARPFQDFLITQEEEIEIRAQVDNLLIIINLMLEESDLAPIDSNWLFNEMFEIELGRSTVISVGIGYAFIPFYEYETFFGIMIRPMWLLYGPIWLGGGGYTGNFNLNIFPPRIEYGDRLGCHIVRTTMFSGLYMNIGDLGYDNIFGGPMLLLGRARVIM